MIKIIIPAVVISLHHHPLLHSILVLFRKQASFSGPLFDILLNRKIIDLDLDFVSSLYEFIVGSVPKKQKLVGWMSKNCLILFIIIGLLDTGNEQGCQVT